MPSLDHERDRLDRRTGSELTIMYETRRHVAEHAILYIRDPCIVDKFPVLNVQVDISGISDW